MPIKPNYQLTRQQRQFVATKQFTDREFPRDVFRRKLEELVSRRRSSPSKYHVITYYGVGGVGKTSLQNQLKHDLTTKIPRAVCASLDFQDQTVHTPARALLELMRTIQGQYKIKFPHFEAAYSLYFYKRNPDIIYNKRQLPYLDELSLVGTVVSALDGMGIIGSVTGIVSLLYQSAQKWGLHQDARRELSILETYSARQIEERLPAFLAFDLKRAIDALRIPAVVFFLDTYEALWGSAQSDVVKHERDAWVRELVAHLPDVLFVIGSREYVEWAAVDVEWADVLDQHLLDSLDTNNAARFLEMCGVDEVAVREKMIAASGGHPYHLDLSVDTYFEMKNRGLPIRPEDFGSNKREILDRFLRYLSEQEIQTLKVMSIPRFYNGPLFRHLLSRYPTGYPVTKFDGFNKFSFIHHEGSKYFIHALMRDGIREYTEEELVREIHRSLTEYYDAILTETTPDPSATVYGESDSALLEAFYHKRSYDTTDALIRWLDAHLSWLRQLQLAGDTYKLQWFLTDLYDADPQRLNLSLFGILVDMVHLSGRYEQAVQMIDERLSGVTEQSWTAETLHLAIRKVHHQMFSVPVPGLISTLMTFIPRARDNNWINEYNELLFMIGGNLGVLSGDLGLARDWLKRSIKTSAQSNSPDYMCRALRKYADVLRLKGHVTWAEKACRQGLKIARDHGYKRYESYLLVTLADINRVQNRYSEAYELLKQADAIIHTLGIVGWSGHLQLTYAEILFQQGDINAAAQYFETAYNIYADVHQTWGLLQAGLGLERCRQQGIPSQIGTPIHETWRQSRVMGYGIQASIAAQIAEGQSPLVHLPYL